MSLSKEDVIRLARLARFDVAPDEIERFRAQLSAILERMEILNELDPAEPVTEPPSTAVRLRADESTPDKLHADLKALTAEMVAGFFTVPRVMP
jgi:aspartyl-tRNA(Asn)/glutamyl-tRNA(Gln) amidotransferase subunit C